MGLTEEEDAGSGDVMKRLSWRECLAFTPQIRTVAALGSDRSNLQGNSGVFWRSVREEENPS
jgi:hypothetical protein